MKEFFAYIDESGDPDFNENASDSFLLCAIIIEKESYQECLELIEGIKRKYSLSEFKSASKLSFNKRLSICYEFTQIDFRILTIQVLKRELDGEWFRIRKTFYKYIQRRLNHEIYRLYNNVQVHIDKFGSQKYQESLQKYLVKSLQGELFDPYIEISSHEFELFIQVADFISGSLRKAIRSEFVDSQKILDILKPKWSVRISLPDNSKYLDTSFLENSDKYFDVCLKESIRYLTVNSNRINSPKNRTLEYLYYSTFEEPDSYIYTAEILNWLSELKMPLTEEQFRTEVIASLRDEGLIIVGTRKGLKIPCKIDDFVEYIKFSTNLTLPILKRMKKAITFINQKTDKIDFEKLLSTEMQSVLNEINV